jgi:micrococcal nuclease
MCYKRLSSWMALLFLFITLNSFNVQAETLIGKVVSVADGDTLTLLDKTKKQYKIRFAAIDAPEKRQAFGNKAKQYLVKLCFGKDAEAIIETVDRYGRYVAEVYCEGINANESLLSEGLAWVYTQYAKKFPHYKDLEDESRLNRIGLWADSNPVPPWEFRRNKL